MTGDAHDGDERELAALLEGADAPRPLPPALRDRLEASLLAPHQPGRMPAAVRARLERSMAGPRVPAVPAARTRILAVAAALLLFVAAAAVAVRSGPGGGDGGQTVAGPSEPTPGAARDEAADLEAGTGTGSSAAPPAVGDVAGDSAGTSAGSDAASPGAAPAAGGAGAGGTAPPFAFGEETAAPSPQAAPDATAGRAETGATGNDGSSGEAETIRIGIIAGDHDLEAGFLAYLDLLADAGGVGGRPVVAVPTSVAEPVAGTIATVNLSGAPVSGAEGVPSWVRQPLLEGPHAPEGALRGGVLSFTSVLERQAHLAVLSAFPEPAPGATAAIYHARSGPYADRVPAALTEALRTRGVTPVLLPTDATAPGLVPADVAFVSLPNGDAGPMLRAMVGAGYAPRLGVWGIGSLFDEDLLDDAPAGLRVLSPYTTPGPEEAAALRAGSGRGLTTGTVHGWVTAKSLAVALWRSGATTAAALDDALAGLAGHHNGFMPPYEVRDGTRSRTPEGLVLVPRAGRFHAAGPFERDPL